MRLVLDHLFTFPPGPTPISSVAEWQTRFAEATVGFEDSADRALIAGFVADRIAYAFAGAYQAALARLVAGKLPEGHGGNITSLCITEEGGGHPKAIKTTLTLNPDGTSLLHGRKQWATGGSLADQLLVAASVGADETGKNRLKLVLVDARASGVAMTEMPSPPFAPELPHAAITFTNVLVRAGDVLPGDGYDTYVKPFRTIEDAHMFLAILGHTIAACRTYGGSNEIIERAATVALALRQIAALDPSAPSTHIALAGAIDIGRRVLAETDPVWALSPSDVRARWERDRALLHVAERARIERRSRAWAQLSRN